MTYITKELLALIGAETELTEATHEVQSSETRRFYQATMDPAPRYFDVKAGARFGGNVAPPVFPLYMFRRGHGTSDPLSTIDQPDADGHTRSFRGLPEIKVDLPRLLNGGYEYEFFRYAKLEEAVLDLQKHMVRSIQIVTRIHDFIKSREPLMEPVRWHDIYQDVIHLLPQTERPAGCRIEWISKAHQSSTWVMGDSIQLSQVLLNLLRNALQAQHVDRLLRLKVLEYVEGMSVSLSISDNGTGMDEATIESALTAFFSTKNDGLGVGLAISKSIMEQHGGSLSIESTLGQGTQITLTLPQLKTT